MKLKKYPKAESYSERTKNGWKAVAKTKVPCGVVVMITREDTVKEANEIIAKRSCLANAAEHISTHNCKN